MPPAFQKAQRFEAGAGPDADGSAASPTSTRNAAAQRVPLPEISAILPSELKS